MSDMGLVPGFERGDYQGNNIIGEVTEAMHRFLLDGWDQENHGPPPRVEEDLSFVPKDREEVIYVYMYKVAQNQALQNSKRLRLTKFSLAEVEDEEGGGPQEAIYYERPPIYLELSYLIAVHSKFRSDAERLLGWTMLRLHEASHLVYRPRRYVLPDGRTVDSTGADWDADAFDDEVIMEKVALALVDDLTVGDAINFFTIHEAPYRPFLTYKARCAMEGALLSGPPTPTEVLPPSMGNQSPPNPDGRSIGRNGRMGVRPTRKK